MFHSIMSLEVRNISYSAPVTFRDKAKSTLRQRILRQKFDASNSGFKPIVKNVSFKVSPGEFVGIIGSSGCGKTSLINIICNKLYTKTWSGDAFLNGQRIGPWAKKSIGYVQQEDILKSTDTVSESINFVADMRLPGNDHRSLVGRIMEGLGLLNVQDSIIGNAAGQGFVAGTTKHGISGGERRRTSIGHQLVSGCELLILDECTSGLDVHTANQIIGLLRRLSELPFDYFVDQDSRRYRLSVVTTIHQPTSQMWQLFDRILVMRAGEIFFNLRPSDFGRALAECEITLPDGTNPADFLIEVLQNADSREAYLLKAWFERQLASEARPAPTEYSEGQQADDPAHPAQYAAQLGDFEPEGTARETTGAGGDNDMVLIEEERVLLDQQIDAGAPNAEANPYEHDANQAHAYPRELTPTDLRYINAHKTLRILPTPGEQYRESRHNRRYSVAQHVLISLYEISHYYAKYTQSYARQFFLLYRRAWMTLARCPHMVLRFFAQFTVMTLFAGSLWWRVGNSYVDVGNKIGALFFIELCLVFPPCADASQRWFEKRQLYLSEHSQGLYGTFPFFIAELLVDMPIFLVLVVYATLISYFMIGINSSFYLCLLLGVEFFMLLCSCMMFSLAMTFFFGSFVAAIAVYMIVISILIVFSGPYINSNSVPAYWSWMQWVSVFTYVFRAQFYLMMFGKEITCDPGTYCPVGDGVTIYDLYGYAGYSFTGATFMAIGYMAGWIFAFGLLAYFNLRYRRFS